MYIKRNKPFYLLACLALLSHVQLVVIYAGVLFQFVSKKLLRLLKTGLVSKTIILVVLFALIPVYTMSDQIVHKFHDYFELRGLSELFKIFIFLGLALWYSQKRLETVLIFIPIIVTVLLMGGERINMLGYFVFLYYALSVNRGFNVGILVTSFYFMTSSFRYLVNIIANGDGFYGI
jgi:hypothetical protein